MHPSADSLINLEFLGSFTGNNIEKMRKYISIFLESAPAEMESLHKNLQEKNWDALRGSAHSLKPQMMYMGIKSGEELLRNMEQHAENGTSLEQMPGWMEALDKIFAQASGELNAYLKQTA